MDSHDQKSTLGERMLGWFGAGLILLAVLVFVFGEGTDGETAGAPPELEIISPTEGSSIEGPLVFEFTAPGDLAPLPGGWGLAPYHLHSEIDGVEYMPAPNDIVRANGAYQWDMGELPPGRYELRLFWADEQHRPVRDGSTGLITVGVR